MNELLTKPEFWQAIASLGWPLVALIAFLSLRGKILSLFGRDNLSIKVAGMEISVADVAKSTGEQVADVQKRLAELELRGDRNSKNLTTLNKVAASRSRTSTKGTTLDMLPLIQPLSILWVDDFPSNNAFLIEALTKIGFRIRTVLSTKDALGEFANSIYDLIISDLGRLEDGNSNQFAGLDLIKSIRQINRKIPILVFAGVRGMKNRDLLIDAGANEVTDSGVELQSFVFKLARLTKREYKL